VSDGALAALSQVLPPPAEPATGEATWDEIAASMGVRFPGELRALIDTYGFGMIGRELTIFGDFAWTSRPRSPPTAVTGPMRGRVTLTLKGGVRTYRAPPAKKPGWVWRRCLMALTVA
jgi:hypothetical protein